VSLQGCWVHTDYGLISDSVFVPGRDTFILTIVLIMICVCTWSDFVSFNYGSNHDMCSYQVGRCRWISRTLVTCTSQWTVHLSTQVWIYLFRIHVFINTCMQLMGRICKFVFTLVLMVNKRPVHLPVQPITLEHIELCALWNNITQLRIQNREWSNVSLLKCIHI